MVHYKLTYFNGRGLAEVTRQLFVLADQKYEDVRHTDETFAPVKSTFPFGQLPVLEVDGQVLAQSHAIARYVARTFGFAGKDAFEQALIDSLADQYKDYTKEIWPYVQAAYGFGPGDAAKLKDEVLLPARAKFLGFITNFLKKNSAHGYLVGDKISWVDLLIAEHTSDISKKAPEYFDGFPEVKAHMELIRQNPRIKNWVESRPETTF